MAKCRIGTAKFFTLLLLLYRTLAKPPGISVTLPQRSLCGLHRLWGVHPAERHHLCLSVACAACIGKCSQNADRTFVDYAVSW